MKKVLITLLFMLVLAACGTENTADEPATNPVENTTDNTTQGSSDVEEKTITLYESDANAEYIVPFEEKFGGTQGDLVPFIFSKVNKHDVELLDYTFENGDKSLVLNLGDDVYTIQGSAGASMFAGTLVRSYFENLPNLEEVTFIHKGSYESILDHMNIGEPYSRQDVDM